MRDAADLASGLSGAAAAVGCGGTGERRKGGQVADRRIEHVVVLMLENRSFDNLLGFLDHPRLEFPRLIEGAYSNPVDPADPTSRQVPVTPDAGYSLPVDPPHSHKSALEQLGVRGQENHRQCCHLL
jgi:hypothetical protein